MASAAGILPLRNLHLYGMTKTFMYYFGTSLSEECDSNLDILTVCPGFVKTNMTLNFDSSSFIKPDQCINGILKVLGQRKMTNTHWIHHLQFRFIGSEIWHQNQWLFGKFQEYSEGDKETQEFTKLVLDDERSKMQ